MKWFDEYDPDCPFCEMENTVEKYMTETSAFKEMFRCTFCYELFTEDERQDERERSKGKEEEPNERNQEEVVAEREERIRRKRWKRQKMKKQKRTLFIAILFLGYFL